MADHQVTSYDLVAVCTQCHQQVQILDGGRVAVHMPLAQRTHVIAPCSCPPPGQEPANYWYCSVHRLGSSAKGPVERGSR